MLIQAHVELVTVGPNLFLGLSFGTLQVLRVSYMYFENSLSVCSFLSALAEGQQAHVSMVCVRSCVNF